MEQLFEGDLNTVEDPSDLLMEVFNNNEVRDVLIKGSNDDFFRFNVIADHIRKAVDPAYRGEEDLMKYKEEMALKAENIVENKI